MATRKREAPDLTRHKSVEKRPNVVKPENQVLDPMEQQVSLHLAGMAAIDFLNLIKTELMEYYCKADSNCKELEGFCLKHQKYQEKAKKYFETVAAYENNRKELCNLMNFFERTLATETKNLETLKQKCTITKQELRKHEAVNELSRLFNPIEVPATSQVPIEKKDALDWKMLRCHQLYQMIVVAKIHIPPVFQEQTPESQFKPFMSDEKASEKVVFEHLQTKFNFECPVTFKMIIELEDKWRSFTEEKLGRCKKLDNKIEALKATNFYEDKAKISRIFANHKKTFEELKKIRNEMKKHKIDQQNQRALEVVTEKLNDAQKILDKIKEDGGTIRECSICVQNYNDNERIPMVGRCGHSICKECSTKLQVVRIKGGKTKTKVQCPTCKAKSTFVRNYAMTPSSPNFEIFERPRNPVSVFLQQVEKL